MTDNNKKRSSFRKIFPILFFSSKGKQKSIKDTHTSSKVNANSSTSRDNPYQNPRSMIERYENRIEKTDENDERIYENLSKISHIQNISESNNTSSSSTLVSENVTNRHHQNVVNITVANEQRKFNYIARPQVPPRPQNEISYSSSVHYNQNNIQSNQYPDVYYHSLEKLEDKISPMDEIEIYKSSRAQNEPASVGAEIKKVSTKFLISPKKEAEVRKMQPTRARSLSLDKKKPTSFNHARKEGITYKIVEKPYNYSAPTSPVTVNHKIPNMPATVSPYEHVRKTMIEAEERRNSLSRSNSRNKSTPSPMPFCNHKTASNDVNTSSFEEDTIKKEETRKHVEAFYWQKIKEMKLKEDEYLLRQSFNNSMRVPRTNLTSYSNSNCSTPISFITDSRTSSLPRGRDINQTPSPFTRGDLERRTDSFLNTKTLRSEPHIVYRHPEKLQAIASKPNLPIFQRGSLTNDTRNVLHQQAKRVSFEEQPHFQKTIFLNSVTRNSEPMTLVVRKDSRNPPQPPVRTSSAVSANKNVRLLPNNKHKVVGGPRVFCSHKVVGGPRVFCSESESGSEAGEIQRIMQSNGRKEEDWQSDPRLDGGVSDGEPSRGPLRGRPSRRDDPRRHTLAGNHLYAQQHALGGIDNGKYGVAIMNIPEYAVPAKIRIMKPYRQIDPRTRKPPLPRYLPSNSNLMLFEDDPGVMSEVETSSTGFRRGGKQRSSLPVVRTPSKTLERPLGLVFLQYRNETKRALLPNEVTSIDTVKALFVRSFSKQLTMSYMDSEYVKIYIHDTSKDMFYELEDVRAHLRDIRDRSVLRLFEAADIGGGVFPGALGVGSVPMPTNSVWDQDQSYFSEPEIDSDYHHQHVHNKNKVKAPAYYMGTQAPSTLPRGGSLLRAFSPAAPPIPADRVKTIPPSGPTAPSKPIRSYIPGSGSERCFPFAAAECPRGTDQLYSIPAHSGDGYMSSPERSAPRPYEDPYYTQFLGPAAGRQNIAPVIDEEANDAVIIDDAYQMYGVNAITTAPRPMPRPGPFDRLGAPLEDMQRLRVEKMERQLANLTGLVQKALQVPAASPAPPVVAPRQEYQPYTPRPAAQDAARFASNGRPPKLGKDRFQKSVSFEKSVSFSDDPPDMNSPKQHSPQHSADTKPTKPAIKSSTLPRTSSQERDRLKPAPPPKPAGLVGQLPLPPQKSCTLNVNPDFFNQLRALQKQSRDLRIETRNLRRSTLNQSVQMRQMMADTITKIGAIAASFCQEDPDSQLTREEEIYRQDMLLLENDLYELEATVERLRGQAANRETRVNMADIERIAMVLSKSSKTVADWKLKFPILQETMKTKLSAEMEKVVRKEKMLEDEPERLELALRRCKKLTGTLVTLKRLACVQEQRLPIADGRVSPSSSQSSITVGPSSEEYTSENTCTNTPTNKGAVGGRVAASRGAADLRPENALDALLDELQTFAKPSERGGRGDARDGPLRRLHSYPSGSDTDASPPVRARGQHPPKPPVPERHPELLALAGRRAPPPPPPRTTSRSPLASPTSPPSPPSPPSPHSPHSPRSPPCLTHPTDTSDEKNASRQALLEHRHQELLRKQKALQEQYARLQMIQRSGPTLPINAQPDLKKTGSESNLLTKLNLNLAPANISGSMTHLAGDCEKNRNDVTSDKHNSHLTAPDAVATTNKVYETDIL